MQAARCCCWAAGAAAGQDRGRPAHGVFRGAPVIYLHDGTHLMADLGADGRGVVVQIISADTQELHDFAQRIALRRAWFQKDAFHPHYDVFGSRPAAALKAGAIAIHFRLLRDCIARARRESRVVNIQEVLR